MLSASAGNAVSSRVATTRLARLTKYRVAALSYRLAPQNPFPAAFLDVLVAYLTLLYPPTGSFHTDVPADHVVLAGDSAGAKHCLALIAMILTLQGSHPAKQPTITFHGRDVPLKLPAGLTLFGIWSDLSNALPSWVSSNGEFDILDIIQPPLLPNYPVDDIWPSAPPRGHPYCEANLLNHPLVSPITMEDWSGSPPIWFGMGSEERGIDGAKMIAAQAAKRGVPILWDEYQGMCHEFAILIKGLPQSLHCFAASAAACKLLASGSVIFSKGRSMKMPLCEVTEVDVPLLNALPFGEVLRRIRNQAEQHPAWLGSTSVKANL